MFQGCHCHQSYWARECMMEFHHTDMKSMPTSIFHWAAIDSENNVGVSLNIFMFLKSSRDIYIYMCIYMYIYRTHIDIIHIYVYPINTFVIVN